MVRRVALVSIVLALLAVAPSAVGKRGITETDLFTFVWVADPQMSPDGSRIAFVRVTVNEKADQYESSLWIANADGSERPRQLTSGIRDTSPRWSPDGLRLAFARSIDKDGKAQPPQIYVMPMAGGEARAITEMARGASGPEWSPDGKTIAFAATAKPEDLAPKSGDKPRESDVRVITEAEYRANGISGSGFVDRDRPSQVWTIALPAAGEPPAPPTRVTSGEFAASSHRWSRDGSQIYFVADRRRESYYYPNDSDIFTVSKDGGEVKTLVSIDGSIIAYAPSPDGKRIAFVGIPAGKPERSYSQPDLWVADIPGGTPRNLTADYDFDINGSIGGDQRSPRGASPAGPIWSADGRSLFIKVGRHGDADLAAFDAQSGKELSGAGADPHHEVISYSADQAVQRVAAVISTPTAIGDLYVIDGMVGASPRKLTAFNDELFGQLAMTGPEEIWYTSFDGRKIQGWIQKPPSFTASQKYPLILEIHGGPHTAYGHTFTHEFQWMAAKGYVVLYTNPRGSSNYGQEFGNIIQFTYPGDDYKDLMAGVDEVLKKGYIDESRMGVTGGSGGGLLTNWVVTQTTRFKAAVSQRDISDWANFWYTADFTLFTPTWFHKAPFEDAAEFARRSPITYVDRIQTPLMFILGDEDYRTPPAAGGEDLFRALKYLKRPTVMVRFPAENHELSRSGKPWHRVERLQHIVGWFDKYLMGKPTATYP